MHGSPKRKLANHIVSQSSKLQREQISQPNNGYES